MAEEIGWGLNCCEKLNVQMQRARPHIKREPWPTICYHQLRKPAHKPCNILPKMTRTLQSVASSFPIVCPPSNLGPITEGQTLFPSQWHRMPCPLLVCPPPAPRLQSGHTWIDPYLYPLQSCPTPFAFESLPKASDGADSLAVQQALKK